MATNDTQPRGDGRGGRHDTEETMRDPHGPGRHRHGPERWAELDRRTMREEIDRRHDWHRGEPRWGGRPGEARWSGGPGEPRWGGEPRGREWAREPERMREALDRRTMREEIDRRHDWRPSARRAYGGGSPGSYGREERGAATYGGSLGYGAEEGYGRYGAAAYGPDDWAEEPGYGGYGGGEYGGSYGGIGPGREGTYQPSGSVAGPSGAGSLAGTFGWSSGWDEERMGMRQENRPTSAMIEEPRRGWEREGPLVRDVMTREPRTVSPDAGVRDAARAMREEDAGIMPVVEQGRVIGVVTDRDLAMRVLAEGRHPDDVRVRDVMSGDVHVCTPDDRLTDAVRIMGEESVRRLPVVDRDDHLKGVLSMTDVAREAEMDYALQEALEQLAARRSFWSRW